LVNKTVFGGHGQLPVIPFHGHLLGAWVQGDIPAALTCFSSINEHRASFNAVIDELPSVSSVAACHHLFVVTTASSCYMDYTFDVAT
jgi:hypothetical protein